MIIRRKEFTEDTSRVETEEFRFLTQGYWFRTEEARREFMDHRNRLNRARKAGVNTNDERAYRAYCLWEKRAETGRYLDEPQMRLDEIREMLDSGGLSNSEFIMKVIDIVEREDHV